MSVDVLRGLKRSNRSPNHYFYNVWATSWKSFARRMEGLAIWEGLNSILEGGCSHRLRFCSFLKNFLIVSGQQKMKKKSGFWRSGASLRILTCFFVFIVFILFLFVYILFLFVFILFLFVCICFYCFYLFLFVFILLLFVFICFLFFPPPPKICSGRGRRLFAHVLGNINSLVPWKASQEVEFEPKPFFYNVWATS